jgi:drug/metabolite transporter (DMT)-like permease
MLFLLWRDGPRGTVRLFMTMGHPGLAVAICFATASGAFVVALRHTTVANILLMQAGTPLSAALIERLVFKEKVAAATRRPNFGHRIGPCLQGAEGHVPG